MKVKATQANDGEADDDHRHADPEHDLVPLDADAEVHEDDAHAVERVVEHRRPPAPGRGRRASGLSKNFKRLSSVAVPPTRPWR